MNNKIPKTKLVSKSPPSQLVKKDLTDQELYDLFEYISDTIDDRKKQKEIKAIDDNSPDFKKLVKLIKEANAFKTIKANVSVNYYLDGIGCYFPDSHYFQDNKELITEDFVFVDEVTDFSDKELKKAIDERAKQFSEINKLCCKIAKRGDLSPEEVFYKIYNRA